MEEDNHVSMENHNQPSKSNMHIIEQMKWVIS